MQKSWKNRPCFGPFGQSVTMLWFHNKFSDISIGNESLNEASEIFIHSL
jgi:hypothetical protein